MTTCRVDLLDADSAKKAAEIAGLPAAFAELNIFRALLHRPKTAKALGDLLLSLLFQGELDPRLRELVIMRIGWATGSEYEWTQHWTIALEQFGCSEGDLLAVRDWRENALFGDEERAVLEATDQLLETGDLEASHVARCLALFGRNPTIELVTAVGLWRLVSKFTRALEIPLEEGVASWPPDGASP
jgi:alkylhydroperoxidase family enzyme